MSNAWLPAAAAHFRTPGLLSAACARRRSCRLPDCLGKASPAGCLGPRTHGSRVWCGISVSRRSSAARTLPAWQSSTRSRFVICACGMARRMSSQRSARADGWVRSGTGAMRRGARSWTALGTAAIRRPCEASARGRPATQASFSPDGCEACARGRDDPERHERCPSAPECGCALAVHSHRRLRVPLELPHRSARRARRGDRLALCFALRLAKCVRQPPGSGRRLLQTRPIRHSPRHSARLRPGDERPRDDVADADRLGTRPHCPHDGPAVA